MAGCPPDSIFSTPCGEVCTYLDFDPDNCGGCGVRCPETSPFCQFGSCSPSCAASTNLCGDVSTDVCIDAANCGRCGIVCPTGYCWNGACAAP